MEENKKELKVIDVVDIAKKLWAKKMLFAKTLPIAFVLSYLYILGFPRYYSTDIKLAPELGGTSMSSTLGSLASSFGFDLDNMQSNDAITPLLYPDLMEDNGFVTSLFNVRVKSKDGSINTTYRDYLKKHQKPIIWMVPIDWCKNLFKKEQKAEAGIFDPYNLSKDEDDKKSAQGKIQIMTMHKSKGDEFNLVVLPELSEKNLPLSVESITLKSADFLEEIKSLNSQYKQKSELELKQETLAENLRLLYVAITRAKNKLFICTSKKEQSFGKLKDSEPNMIFSEILQNVERGEV